MREVGEFVRTREAASGLISQSLAHLRELGSRERDLNPRAAF